jgi:hypothetical protein
MQDLSDFIHTQASVCENSVVITINNARPVTSKNIPVSSAFKKHYSVQDVHNTMEEMDRIHHTSFSSWIRSESNLQYLYTLKGKMILAYIDKDPKSAMLALEWMTAEWSVDSVAELVLKLFYADRISSLKFSERLYALVRSWKLEKFNMLLLILLVGETTSTCAQFFANFATVSLFDSHLMSEIVLPVAGGFMWEEGDLSEFLVEFVSATISNPMVQRSLMLVVHDEFERIILDPTKTRKDILNIFELLLCIIIDESTSMSFANVLQDIESVNFV